MQMEKKLKIVNKLIFTLMFIGVIFIQSGILANNSYADTFIYEQSIGGSYRTDYNVRFVPNSGYGYNTDPSYTTINIPWSTTFQIVEFTEDYNSTQSKLVFRIYGCDGASNSTIMQSIDYIDYYSSLVIYDSDGVVIAPQSSGTPLTIKFLSDGSSTRGEGEVTYIFDKSKKIKDMYINHKIEAYSKQFYYDGPWIVPTGRTDSWRGQIKQYNTTGGHYLDKSTVYTKIYCPNLYNSNPTLSAVITSKEILGKGRINALDLTYSLKDDANDRNYMKYKILNSQGAQVIAPTALSLVAKSGSDGTGDYAIANGNVQNYQSGKIDTSALDYGMYTVVFWAEDNKGAKSAEVTKSIEITSIPTFNSYDLSSTVSSIGVKALGADSRNALDANPYQFTYRQLPEGVILPNAPVWRNLGEVQFESLLANTHYEVKAKVKNAKGVVSEETKSIYTEALIPVVAVENITHSAVTVAFTEANPGNTKYKILVGTDQSIDVEGNVVPIGDGAWIVPVEKKLTVKGLLQGNDYKVSAMAQNWEGKETTVSNPVFPRTAGGPPEAVNEIYTELSHDGVIAYWDAVENISNYRVKFNGVEVATGPKNPYISFDKATYGIVPESVYAIEVAAHNAAGDSQWKKVQVRTTSQPPEVPSFGTMKVWNKSIQLQWDPAPRAMKYQLEIDGLSIDVYKNQKYVHSGLAPGSQHIYRIRAVNNGGSSPWSSPIVKVTSMNDLTGKAILINEPVATNDSVILSWIPTEDVESYVVQVDDETLVDVGNETFSIHGGLEKDTNYIFKVYGLNPYGGQSLVANTEVRTYAMAAPENFKVKEGIKLLELTWGAVPEATSYEIEVNGVILAEEVQGGTQFTYSVDDPSVPRTVKVRAKKKISDTEYKYSSWTNPVTATADDAMPGKAKKLRAIGSNQRIILTWENPQEGTPVAYDVMITDFDMNQVVLEAIENQRFIHEMVIPFKTYQYSVRAKSDTSDGEWSDSIAIRTLPSKPETPKDIAVNNRRSTATIMWTAIESAIGYEIAVKQEDGTFKEIPVGDRAEYIQKNTPYKKESVYKVRAKNMIGYSQWSDLIVNNSIRALTKTGESLDLGLTATDVVDFSKYELQVSYNPGVLEIEDICGYTTELETDIGKIEGTDIEVVSHKPGLIKFRVEKGIKEGYTWTGVVNNIKFTPKLSGATYITYTVFVEENE